MKGESPIELETREKNRKKLMQQNIKVYAELMKMANEIQSMQLFSQKKQQESSAIVQLKAQIEVQQRQIRQLKEEVDIGRQSKLKENLYFIKKQEDQLLFLKKELQASLTEKFLLSQGHQDKMRKLSQNQPLLAHKRQMEKSCSDAKKQNRQISIKILQIQRQVRKLHSLREGAKDKSSSGQQLQLASLEAQIARMTTEMRDKDAQWKPSGEILDNDFFASKNNLNNQKKRVDELQKEEGIWKVRSAALRDSKSIEQDKARLAKVGVSPSSKPEAISQLHIVLPLPPQKHSFERVIQKQLKDKIKYDKYVDLVRVVTSPTNISQIKKQLQISSLSSKPKLIRSQSEEKEIPILNNKKQVPQVLSLFQINKMKKQESLKINPQSPIKKQKSQKQYSKISASPFKKSKNPPPILPEEKMIEISQVNNRLGRIQKIKSKQTNAGNLAEIIRRKAEEVKKINKKLQKQQQKNVLISDKSKSRIKSPKRQNQKEISKNKQMINQEPRSLSAQKKKKIPAKDIKQKKALSLKGSLQTTILQENMKIKNQKTKDVKKKELLQKINLIPPKQIPKSTNIKINEMNFHQQEKNSKEIKKKHPQFQSIAQNYSPKYQRKKPLFEIFVSDRQEISQIKHNDHQNSQNDLEQEGIPKKVKRKILAEGSHFSIGTST